MGFLFRALGKISKTLATITYLSLIMKNWPISLLYKSLNKWGCPPLTLAQILSTPNSEKNPHIIWHMRWDKTEFHRIRSHKKQNSVFPLYCQSEKESFWYVQAMKSFIPLASKSKISCNIFKNKTRLKYFNKTIYLIIFLAHFVGID